MNRTQYYSLIAMLSATAGAMTLAHLEFPFPLLPFLQFDLAEVPDTVAFMLLGPAGGLLTLLIHTLILYTHGSFTVFSPIFKFLAVSPMFLGMYIGGSLSKNWSKKSRYIIIILLGTTMRVIVDLFATLALYFVIMPSLYLPTANLAMSIVGIHISNPFEIALFLSGITSLFNLIAAPITIILSYAVMGALGKRVKGASKFL
ncbi:MAG: hypothetical protein JRN19_07205 [Nitrososphaerota archaeon]|nr:hypothetical protein [Nitrososphaerota archaeon]